jgi:hypothetical protein
MGAVGTGYGKTPPGPTAPVARPRVPGSIRLGQRLFSATADLYLMNRSMFAFGESMVSGLEWTAFVEGGEISEDYLAMTRLEEALKVREGRRH